MSQILLSCNYNTSKRQVEYLVFDKNTVKVTVVLDTDLVDNKSDHDKVTKLVDWQNKENKLALVYLARINDMLAFADHAGNIYILKNGEALAIEGSGIRLINCKIYDKTGTIGCINFDRVLQTESLAGKVKFTVLLALGLENGINLAKAGFKNLVYNPENVSKSVKYLKFILSSNHKSSIIQDCMKYITSMLYDDSNIAPLYMLRNSGINFLVWSYNHELGFNITLSEADTNYTFKDISSLRIEMPYDEDVVSGKASDLLLNANKGSVICRVNVDWKTFNIIGNQMIYEFYCNGADVLKNSTGAKITLVIDKDGKIYFDIASYNSNLQNGYFRGLKRLYEFGQRCTNLNIDFLSAYGDHVNHYMTDNSGCLVTSMKKSAEARYNLFRALLKSGSQISGKQDCIKFEMSPEDFYYGIKCTSGPWFEKRRITRVAKTQVIKLGGYDFAVASISDKSIPAFLTPSSTGMAAYLVKYEVYKDGILANTVFGYDLYTILCSFTFASMSGISSMYAKYSLADFKYALKENESYLKNGWVTPVDIWNLSKAFMPVNPQNLLDYRKSIREVTWELVDDPLTGLVWFAIAFKESAGFGDGASYIKMTNVSDLGLIDQRDNNEFVRKIFAFKDTNKAIDFFKAITESSDSPLRTYVVSDLARKLAQSYQSSRGISSGILYDRAMVEVNKLNQNSLDAVILNRIAGKNVEDTAMRNKLSEFGIIGG